MASPGDDSNPLGPAMPLLLAAVELGGRAAAAGDPAGAGELYACAARLTRRVRGVSEVADFRLERALDEAEAADPREAAEVLRAAFDSLLPDGDPEPPPADPRAAVQRFVGLAISIGAPAYNLGDRRGCYDVYACTARMILATVPGTDAGQPRLRQALDECDGLADPDKKAWALRHGFDAVLELGEPAADGGVAPAEVRSLLAMAIAVGAPAFNLGDTRGCYEVYACTARLLVHTAAVPADVKDRLRAALQEAAVVADPGRQAWVLRHAFDAVLGGGPPADGKPADDADDGDDSDDGSDD